MVLRLGDIGKCIRNTRKVLKCGAGEDQLGRSYEKLTITQSQGG
jgi:hypothetical protein